MSWTFGTSISAPVETNPGVSFGVAVAVSNDYIAIASRGTTPSLHTHYIEPGSLTPTPAGQVLGPSDSSSETFGSDISINNDFVAVGDSQGDGGYGQVSIYKLPKSKTDNLTLVQTLPGSDVGVDAGGGFGQSVSLGQSFLVIGAPDAKQAIVYNYTSGNIDLDSKYPLTATGVSVGANPDGFGYSVSVNDDNDVFMVGDRVGNIFPYKYNTIGNIKPITKITTSLTGIGNIINVSINGDIAVAGFPDSDSGTGALQLYSYSQTSETFSVDTADESSIPLPTNAIPGTSAGFSNSYSDDYIVTGGPGHSNEAGLVQIYAITSEVASEDQLPRKVSIINNPTPSDGDQLGFSVSIKNFYMVAGAPNGGTDSKGYVNFYYLNY